MRFTPSEQAQKLEDVAFDLENSTSPHSGWFKFEDEAAAKIANVGSSYHPVHELTKE